MHDELAFVSGLKKICNAIVSVLTPEYTRIYTLGEEGTDSITPTTVYDTKQGIVFIHQFKISISYLVYMYREKRRSCEIYSGKHKLVRLAFTKTENGIPGVFRTTLRYTIREIRHRKHFISVPG